MTRNTLSSRNIATRVLAGIVILVLLLVTVMAQPSHSGTWLRTFNEALHVPVFGVIAVCLLILTPGHWSSRMRLLVAMLATVVLAALSEVAQIPTARDASLQDLIADLLGAAGFLVAAIPLSSSFSVRKGHGRYLVLLGALLVAWPLAPLARVSAAYVERSQISPSLVRFDTRFAHVFFRLQNTDLRKIEDADSDSVYAEISLKDAPWPGIVFHDLWPDWESHRTLMVAIENPESTALPINIRVHDLEHRWSEQNYSDRFNKQMQLEPGVHTLEFAIADIRDAPADRTMDMAHIDGLVVFATQQEAGRKFVLREIWLD